MKLNHIQNVVSDLIDVSTREGTLKPLEDADRAKFARRLEDAFVSGNVDVAIAELCARAKNERAKQTISNLAQSAIQSLGIDPKSANMSWSKTFSMLGTIYAPSTNVSLRTSPARDAFRGIRMPMNSHTERVLQRISAQTARIDQSLRLASQSTEPVLSYRRLVSRVDLSKLHDGALMKLVSGFANAGAWQDSLDVLSKAPREFQKLPISRRIQSLALIQLGENESARSIIEQSIASGQKDNSTYGLLAKCHILDFDQTGADKPEQADLALERAIAACKEAFRADPSELYPAVCLPGYLEIHGGAAAKHEAAQFGETVLAIALQNIKRSPQTYWSHAAALSVGLQKDDSKLVRTMLVRLQDCFTEPWMVESTINSLTRIRDVKKERNQPVTHYDQAIESLRTKGRRVQGVQQQISSDSKTDKLLSCTYRYAARFSRRLGGNYHLNGIAHDMRFTPADFHYFTRVLEDQGLMKIATPQEVSKAIDKVIREHFNTSAMEDLDGETHEDFDQLMPKLAAYMGATTENSQTNVSADWINGLADCRQHAPIKMLMYETWRRQKKRKLIKKFDRANQRGNQSAAKAHLRQLSDISAWDMRILDCEIIDKTSNEFLEEHTMTLLVQQRPSDTDSHASVIEEVHLADSFYQDVHRLDSGKVELREKGSAIFIDVPKTSANGRSITLKPASYSFDRSRASIDYGQLIFRGIPVATPGWEESIPTNGIDLAYFHKHLKTK